MSSYSIDALVIGAGVVGLAIARRLAQSGLETIILEKAEGIGTGTSSRNSEVVHAGLYYPTGSIRARTCIAGRKQLYDYCAQNHVPVKRCGKLMVACHDGQNAKLDAIESQARLNGVTGITRLTPRDVERLEPEVHCVSAFLSAETGIVDSHAFMLALQGDYEAAGGMIAFNTPVLGGWTKPGEIIVETGGGDPATIRTKILINAAGHGAPKTLAKFAHFPASCIPRQWYAKGNYFSLLGRQPFSRLVYPMPDAAGLGVHATIDLSGRCRFGPDVQWVAHEDDLEVNPQRAEYFYNAIRTYWPHLPENALQSDYAGIRPKLHDETMPMPDFRIDGAEIHGIEGAINLFGIESPGLTASLALADLVAEKLALLPVAQ